MSRPVFLCVPLSALLCLFAGLSWTGAADPPAKPADPGSVDDVADFVVILEHRPILVRMHVTVDGEPYTKHWENQLKRLFDFLDRDANGYLDKEEATVIPNFYLLQKLFTGDISFGIQNPGNGAMPFVPGNIAPAFEDLDTNSDGRITFEEFVRYYRHTEAGPLEFMTRNTQGVSADALTDLLFRVLNTNKDGKLSKAELLVAEKVLSQFDTNDDELVSAQELMAEAPNRGGANGGNLFPGTILPGKLFNNVPIMVIPREDAARQVTRRMPAVKELISHYDKDQRQKVSAEQIGFPKELAEKLGIAQSGWLGPKELTKWIVFHPDVEMTVRLGRSPGGDRVQVPLPEDEKARPPFTPAKSGENSLAVALDAIHMTVVRAESQPPQDQGVKAQYMQQFKAVDTKRNGYLKLDQLKLLPKDPNAIILLALFPWADRDTNEKLTEKELSDFLDLMFSLRGAQARLTFADNGQSLFELLDANHDGQLSIHELRTAWKRLEVYDKDKKGSIARSEIPRQYQVLVSQGEPFMSQNNEAGANFGVTVVQSIPTRGPLWFRKMDVNNDGFVSEREFLGSKEDFKKIDTDGDGLISVEEAEKADAWFREKMKKQ